MILLFESPFPYHLSKILGRDLQVQRAMVKYKDLSIAAMNSPSQTALELRGKQLGWILR